MRLIHQTCRLYASQSKPPPRRLNQTISLDNVKNLHLAPSSPSNSNSNLDYPQFLQRSRALGLWRTILRGCKRIPDPRTKKETVGFAREEFKRNKNVTDLVFIFFLYLGRWFLWIRLSECLDANPVFDFDGEDAVGGDGEVY